MSDIQIEVCNGVGMITLNRPKALNALSLPMIRELTAALLGWRDLDTVHAVAIRGHGKEGPFGAFCAGGDIRFFHQAALSGDPRLEDFFTEEYNLNHLIHGYPKPYIAFLDGIVMGGGMGISGHTREGAKHRIVTERTKMAMPETNIGLFPDVGGGYFLSRCPGRTGEYLALTGHMFGGVDALQLGLADLMVESASLNDLWGEVARTGLVALEYAKKSDVSGQSGALAPHRRQIDHFFGLASVKEIIDALEADDSKWATDTAATLRQRSPLMLHVVLEQVRRARSLGLADDLRMERDMVRNSFHLRPGAASETVEGVRALAVDKDHSPRWNPVRIEDVTSEMWRAFFNSPWPAHSHPLRSLG